MRTALEVVRFLLELCLLAGAAWAGLDLSWVLAVLAPIAVAVVWGLWVAPKAGRRLADPGRLVLELALFLAVGVGMVAAGHVVAAVLLLVASAAVAVGLRMTGSAA